MVYFWGLLRLLWFTWGLRVVYIAFLLVVGVVLGWGRMVAEATFFMVFFNIVLNSYYFQKTICRSEKSRRLIAGIESNKASHKTDHDI